MRATLMTVIASVLFGLFLLPSTALAAPAIALAPAALPRGGATTVTGTGFAPGATLALFIGLAQLGGARAKVADLTAAPDGGFTTTVRLPGGFRPGPTPVVVVGGGVDLAQATLTVTDAPSIAPERLAVTPNTGPVGTLFAAVGTGLTPGQAVALFTTESAKGPAGRFREIARLTVPADGRVAVDIDSAGYTPEGYDLLVFGPGGPAIGLPLVVAKFTVSAPAMPGLPNTGRGGADRDASGGLSLAALLGLGLLGGLGLLDVGRRRRAARRRG